MEFRDAGDHVRRATCTSPAARGHPERNGPSLFAASVARTRRLHPATRRRLQGRRRARTVAGPSGSRSGEASRRSAPCRQEQHGRWWSPRPLWLGIASRVSSRARSPRQSGVSAPGHRPGAVTTTVRRRRRLRSRRVGRPARRKTGDRPTRYVTTKTPTTMESEPERGSFGVDETLHGRCTSQLTRTSRTSTRLSSPRVDGVVTLADDLDGVHVSECRSVGDRSAISAQRTSPRPADSACKCPILTTSELSLAPISQGVEREQRAVAEHTLRRDDRRLVAVRSGSTSGTVESGKLSRSTITGATSAANTGRGEWWLDDCVATPARRPSLQCCSKLPAAHFGAS